ncbi:MAG: ABC transporter permease [Acidimicrobiales bacterium]
MTTMTAGPTHRTTSMMQPTRRTGTRPNGGHLGLVALAAWTELRSSARSAEFTVGAIGIPLLLYTMFGLPNPNELDGGTTLRTAMLVSLSAYGVVSLAIFSFGENVAKERGRGWTRTLRATPLPTSTHLLGKTATAMVHAVLIVAAMSTLAATAGGVDLPASTWAAFGATMVAGVVAFSTLGFAIALLARPRAATVITNLIFLPLAFASGFFVPLSELPATMRTIAPWLPTFHFGQLAYRIVMPTSDVEDLTGVATGSIATHLAWVTAATVALAGLALLAARREAVTRRG